jgi:hypothetical protein
MTINNDYLALLVEATEWFDWMTCKARWNMFSQLSDEVRVLFAIRAVQYANELEPKHCGRLSGRIRNRLIRCRLVDQYCEYLNSSAIQMVSRSQRKARK